MKEGKPIWKHNSVYMTVICFVAFYLGKYSEIIKAVFKIGVIIAGIYTLMNLAGISVEIIKEGEVLMRIF